MKNNDLQELKPIYLHETSYSVDSEVSLVDLAMTLVRRKRMITIITCSIIALGVITALFVPKKYTFSTSIEIGSQIIIDEVKPFESPQTLLAKLQHNFIPQTLNEYRSSNAGDEKKYKIKTKIPNGSEIIVLEAMGTENEASLISSLLRNVSTKATQDHKRIFEAIKQNYDASIEQAKTELSLLNSKKNVQTEKIQLLKNRVELYNSQLANLRNTREILPPMKSIEPTGTSRKLIVIIATFAGIFLAVFSAFFAEFIAKVKEKTQADSE